jgi:hypothetical protein
MLRMLTRFGFPVLLLRKTLNMRLFAALLGSSLLALPASAETIISSYPAVDDGGRTLGFLDDLAVGFTIGSTAQNLGSATIRLSGVSGFDQIDTSTIQASLYGGTAANPANPVLVTFTPAPGIISEPALDLVLTPTSTFTLDASTTYWLVVEAPSVTKDLSWKTALIPATGTLAAYVGARSGSSAPPTNEFSGNLIFAIDTTVVPEPGTLSLTGVAFGSLSLMRRSRPRS